MWMSYLWDNFHWLFWLFFKNLGHNKTKKKSIFSKLGFHYSCVAECQKFVSGTFFALQNFCNKEIWVKQSHATWSGAALAVSVIPLTFLPDHRGWSVCIPQKEILMGCLPKFVLLNNVNDSSQYVCFRFFSCKNPACSKPITETNA